MLKDTFFNLYVVDVFFFLFVSKAPGKSLSSQSLLGTGLN